MTDSGHEQGTQEGGLRKVQRARTGATGEQHHTLLTQMAAQKAQAHTGDTPHIGRCEH
jgi:hypothetical protein